MFARLTPVAEVLTVVPYHIVAPLSEPRAGAENYAVSAESVRLTSNLHGAATTKLTDRDLLNQSAWIAEPPCVVNYTAATDVDSMVAVASAGNHELRSHSKFHGLHGQTGGIQTRAGLVPTQSPCPSSDTDPARCPPGIDDKSAVECADPERSWRTRPHLGLVRDESR